jgi:hypothetical protein
MAIMYNFVTGSTYINYWLKFRFSAESRKQMMDSHEFFTMETITDRAMIKVFFAATRHNQQPE